MGVGKGINIAAALLARDQWPNKTFYFSPTPFHITDYFVLCMHHSRMIHSLDFQ